MRASDFINEDLSRRNFLRGAGALAAAAAVTPAIGGEYQSWNSWAGDDKLLKLWDKRWRELTVRMNRVVKKLYSVATPDQMKMFNGIDYEVDQTSKSATYSLKDRRIVLDLSIYWDLTDDAIAYTIAHELGHAYYEHGGYQGKTSEDNYKQELLADAFGAKLAFKAGYDPRKCFADFSELNKKQPGSDTHPGYRDRVQHIKKETGIAVSHINRGMQLINTPLSQIAQA